jgi:hypothetical protein
MSCEVQPTPSHGGCMYCTCGKRHSHHAIGSRVLAFWRDTRPGKYFATVLKVNESGSYQLEYLDGDVDKDCPASSVFHADYDKDKVCECVCV